MCFLGVLLINILIRYRAMKVDFTSQDDWSSTYECLPGSRAEHEKVVVGGFQKGKLIMIFRCASIS